LVEHQTINELQNSLRNMFPEDAYDVVQKQIQRMHQAHPVTVLSIGSVISLWVASTLFMSVMDALNHIYGVQEKRRYWRRRVLAMVMTVIQSIFFLGCLGSIVIWPQVITRLGLQGFASYLLSFLHLVVAFIATLISFALTFQIGPPSKQRVFWITPGSLFGAAIFIAISFGFRTYVQNFGAYDRVYGSLGGVMVLLLWFWLTSAVVLGAAATNKVLEELHESSGRSRTSDGENGQNPQSIEIENKEENQNQE
jgi:membrane protein